MTGIALFLISLPLAVYCLSGLFLLIDRPNRLDGLVQLAVRIMLVAALLALAPAGDRIWIASAFLLVIVLHVVAHLLLRIGIGRGWWISDRIE